MVRVFVPWPQVNLFRNPCKIVALEEHWPIDIDSHGAQQQVQFVTIVSFCKRFLRRQCIHAVALFPTTQHHWGYSCAPIASMQTLVAMNSFRHIAIHIRCHAYWSARNHHRQCVLCIPPTSPKYRKGTRSAHLSSGETRHDQMHSGCPGELVIQNEQEWMWNPNDRRHQLEHPATLASHQPPLVR